MPDYPAVTRSTVALILHGFTGMLSTVRILGDVCDERDLPSTMPVLRGHGTLPEDLEGVTWREWYEDAEAALFEITSKGEKAIVMGLSMGGLVTLDLASRHPDRICGVVTVNACMRLAPRLLALLPLIARVKPYWEGQKKTMEARGIHAYPRFPTRTLASLVEYTRVIPTRLSHVTQPMLVVQSWGDLVVRPSAARAIYDGISSRDKELARFEDRQHDMLLGPGREDVAHRIGEWLDARRPLWSPCPGAGGKSQETGREAGR